MGTKLRLLSTYVVLEDPKGSLQAVLRCKRSQMMVFDDRSSCEDNNLMLQSEDRIIYLSCNSPDVRKLRYCRFLCIVIFVSLNFQTISGSNLISHENFSNCKLGIEMMGFVAFRVEALIIGTLISFQPEKFEI